MKLPASPPLTCTRPHPYPESHASPPIINCMKHTARLCLPCQTNAYVTVNTKVSSRPPLWHGIPSLTAVICEARQGEASVARYSWAWRSACAGIQGGPTVSSVSRWVRTNSPAWCEISSAKQSLRELAEAPQPGPLPHQDLTGPLDTWCCRACGAKDEPKWVRGPVLHPDGGPTGSIPQSWTPGRLLWSKNNYRQPARYAPASLTSIRSVPTETFLGLFVVVTFS